MRRTNQSNKEQAEGNLTATISKLLSNKGSTTSRAENSGGLSNKTVGDTPKEIKAQYKVES